jgi:hypothetical protein
VLEGEKNALLNQVTVNIEATKKRLRALGLKYVEVGLFDERTRQPISDPQYLIDMAEGKPLPESFFRQLDAVKEAVNQANAEGGAPVERAEGPDK